MNERPRWQRALSSLGRAFCYLMLFLGWQFVVSAIYSATITMELATDDMEAITDAVLARTMEVSLVSGLLTLASVVLFFLARHEKLRRELWLRPAPPKVFALGAVLALCLYWVVTFVMGLLPDVWMEGYAEASAGLEEASTLAFIATALVAPVTEEIVFRGLVYTRLEQGLPRPLAVVLSAAIFGACHGELVWFCYAFVLGLIFALIACATRSILPGMLMHILFNATNETLALLENWEPSNLAMAGIFALALAGTAASGYGLYRALAPALFPMPAAAPPETIEITNED